MKIYLFLNLSLMNNCCMYPINLGMLILQIILSLIKCLRIGLNKIGLNFLLRLSISFGMIHTCLSTVLIK